MKIINRKFDIRDKNELIEKYDVKPVHGVNGINENIDSVYVSRNGDVLVFSLFRKVNYTYSYWSADETCKYTDRWGYVIINIKHNDLLGNHEQRMVKLHRLVACTWIDNPYNLRDVDHINCDKTNNSIDNLEWVTHAENCRRYWANHVNETTRMYVECCGSNMLVSQTVNIGDYKIRYRKCKHCGRRIMTKQVIDENEFIVKEL